MDSNPHLTPVNLDKVPCEDAEGEATRVMRIALGKVEESLQVKRSARESVVRLVSQPQLAKRRK